MNRTINVARMQLINKWTFLGIPAIILVAAFLLSVAIWAMVPSSADITLYTGAGQAVMWYFMVIGIQALTLTFPFSQGLSISRRTFYLGTVGLFTTVALCVAVLYYLLSLIEAATGGWGLDGIMFGLPWVADGLWYQTISFYFVAMMFLFLIGFWSATVYKRWGPTGLLLAGIAVAALLVAAIAVVNAQQWWAQVGLWFAGQTSLTVAGWAGLLCVALAGGSYLTLRRATP